MYVNRVAVAHITFGNWWSIVERETPKKKLRKEAKALAESDNLDSCVYVIIKSRSLQTQQIHVLGNLCTGSKTGRRAGGCGRRLQGC